MSECALDVFFKMSQCVLDGYQNEQRCPRKMKYKFPDELVLSAPVHRPPNEAVSQKNRYRSHSILVTDCRMWQHALQPKQTGGWSSSTDRWQRGSVDGGPLKMDILLDIRYTIYNLECPSMKLQYTATKLQHATLLSILTPGSERWHVKLLDKFQQSTAGF